MAYAEATRSFDLRAAGALALSIAVALAAGALGGLTTSAEYYRALEVPAWAPPAWLFGPVWTVLYVLMGVAAFWVWRAGARAALIAYAVQLALNAAWTPIFFGLREPAWALVELCALWIAIVVTMALFARVRIGAAVLLLPYLAWVTFAGILNWQIVALS